MKHRTKIHDHAKAGILMMAALFSFGVSAQRAIGLDEALEMAVGNSARIKMADAGIQQAKAAKGENWEVPSTSASYSRGQINSDTKKDWQFSVEQGLGSFLTPFYKNALVNSRVRTGGYYRDIVEREVRAEVKRAWTEYQYAFNLCSLYRDYEKMSGDLQRIGEVRYQQGDITLLDKQMMNTIAADMRSKRFQAEQQLSLASQRFQWTCYSDDPIVPSDTALVPFIVPRSIAVPSELYGNYFNSLAEEKANAVKVERSRYFPEFSVGYVRQDILPLKNLNSWMVGVSIPILFSPVRSKVQQAHHAAISAQIESNEQQRQMTYKLKQQESSLTRYSESLSYYKNSALKEADELIRAANKQLEASETSITEYIQSLNAAREIKRGYLETVYNYNVAALEYELYRNE